MVSLKTSETEDHYFFDNMKRVQIWGAKKKQRHSDNLTFLIYLEKFIFFPTWQGWEEWI